MVVRLAFSIIARVPVLHGVVAALTRCDDRPIPFSVKPVPRIYICSDCGVRGAANVMAMVVDDGDYDRLPFGQCLDCRDLEIRFGRRDWRDGIRETDALALVGR